MKILKEETNHFSSQITIPTIIYPSSSPILGELKVIGDKSVSFRSLFFGLMTSGCITIKGINYGEDIHKTLSAFKSLGVKIEYNDDYCKIYGNSGKLIKPIIPLDVGGSATSARLILGLLSGQNFSASICGNQTLSKRPMTRSKELLEKAGARITLTNDCLPATISSNQIHSFDINLPYTSAQLQTSIILAALQANGASTITYSPFIRNHTERILESLGFEFQRSLDNLGNKVIKIQGNQKITNNLEYQIYGDPSMAAYFIVAALLIPGSDLIIKDMYIQSNRIGYLKILQEMGGDIEISNIRNIHNEEVGDVRVKYSKLQGTNIPAHLAPTMIDEYPILAVAASFAQGITTMHGLSELKAKESNRIVSISQCLKQLSIHCDINHDSMTIMGTKTQPQGGVLINSFDDHRIVMSFRVFGLMTRDPIEINDSSSVLATFPDFFRKL